MAMMPSGEIVPLNEDLLKAFRETGLVRGEPATLVAVGDTVIVNGRECRVRKVTDKDIVLRPIPVTPA